MQRMISLLRIRPARALPLLGLASVLLLGLAPVGADEDNTVQVTTDTVAYCEQLHDRVEAMMRAGTGAPPMEVTLLSSEGQRMCDNGLARGGILRLRRAIAIMTHPDGAN